ncbi:MAG: hypothetical protein BGO07_03705 [Alphaproteobacteria bacterium 40-19]|nr:MAG: hypothetical protein BGO07_03705 [Alphaproteobacteria bacterium 40-19]
MSTESTQTSEQFFKRYFQAGYLFTGGIFLFFLGLFAFSPGFFILNECTLDFIQQSPEKCSLQKVFFGSSQLPEPQGPLSGIGAFIISTDQPSAQLLEKNLPSFQIPFQQLTKITDADIAKQGSVIHVLHSPSKENPDYFKQFIQHVQAWRTFLASSYQWGLILEDNLHYLTFPARSQSPFPYSYHPSVKDLDQIRAKKELYSADQKLKVLTQSHCADIFFLSANRQSVYLKMIKNSPAPVGIILGGIPSSGAYLINRYGAKQLLQKAHLYLVPLEHYFSRFWEFNMRAGRPLFCDFDRSADNLEMPDLKYPFCENTSALLLKLQRQIFNLKKALAEFFYRIKVQWK